MTSWPVHADSSSPDALPLHPWNTDFEWTSQTGPFEVLTVEQAAAFDRDGFVVLPDVFDEATISRVRDETDVYEAETEHALRQLDGGRMSIAESDAITFTTHLVTRSDTLRRFAAHPAFTGLCHDLVGPDANLYWDQAVYKKPEKPRRFPWHQDNGYAFVTPQQYLTCWVALNDGDGLHGRHSAALQGQCPTQIRARQETVAAFATGSSAAAVLVVTLGTRARWAVAGQALLGRPSSRPRCYWQIRTGAAGRVSLRSGTTLPDTLAASPPPAPLGCGGGR